jgi:hypothetical protein
VESLGSVVSIWLVYNPGNISSGISEISSKYLASYSPGNISSGIPEISSKYLASYSAGNIANMVRENPEISSK